MKTRLARKFMAMFFTFCMALSFVPIPAFATESNKITEVNINDISNELWSYNNVSFATVDESSPYTIASQKWYAENSGTITPESENLKPKAGEEYSFTITLAVKDNYAFPVKAESDSYDGVFKLNETQYEVDSTTVSSDRKNLTATLFTDTRVKGIADIPPGSRVVYDTTVRDNFTDLQVEDNINLKEGSDYIIDFTKEDNLSMALRAMADVDEKNPEKTIYYKFANSDNNSLIKTENVSEALIKIVGSKSENKAVMTLVGNIDEDASYALKFMYTEYTGDKLTFTGWQYYEDENKYVINEIRDDYYTRYHFDCKLNLINSSSELPQTPDTDVYEIIEGANSSWIQNSDETLTFRIDGDLSKFVGIKVDDEWVDKENYVTDSGSTIVTLKDEYLKTLSVGEHKITFVYTDGEVSTNFEVKEAEKPEKTENSMDVPKTGDNINILLWLSLILASALIVFVSGRYYVDENDII